MANERYLKPDDQSGEKTPSGTAGLLDLSEIPLSSPLFDAGDRPDLVVKAGKRSLFSAKACCFCFEYFIKIGDNR